eukprot:5150877-Prymnesium_polylepis.1
MVCRYGALDPAGRWSAVLARHRHSGWRVCADSSPGGCHTALSFFGSKGGGGLTSRTGYGFSRVLRGGSLS